MNNKVVSLIRAGSSRVVVFFHSVKKSWKKVETDGKLKKTHRTKGRKIHFHCHFLFRVYSSDKYKFGKIKKEI